jgi:hypothetical protein
MLKQYHGTGIFQGIHTVFCDIMMIATMLHAPASGGRLIVRGFTVTCVRSLVWVFCQ